METLINSEIWLSLSPLKLSRYYVSSLGRIYSINYGILDGNKTSAGYIRLNLTYDDGKGKRIFLHSLIATMFCIKLTVNHSSVDHINRIKDDNRVINLRWATRGEQRINRNTVEHTGKSVCQYDNEMKIIKIWNKITDAASNLKLNAGSISTACKKKQSYGNYYWLYHIDEYIDEIWCPILYDEYDNISISSYGRIKLISGKVTKGTLNAEGYLQICLRNKYNNEETTYSVHRLVAATFLGINKELMVNHKDRNKSNNHVNNLEYVTAKENSVHAYTTGLNKSSRAVKQYDLNDNFIKEYRSGAEASRQTGCNRGHISNVCRGVYKTTGGFKWKYANN